MAWKRLYTKPSQRFDRLLFFYVSALLVGSAVWLRMIPAGDLSGRGIKRPLWMENAGGSGRHADGRPLPSISGLQMYVNQEQCNFTSADDESGCGADNPQISVTATIESHTAVPRGISLAIYSSNDFEFWRQANSIELPRDMFSRESSDGPMTVTTSACFGEPGAYYVVACAREGVPPGGAASNAARPSCQQPPCAGSVGPPFALCLGIAPQCISTCNSGATEVVPQRMYLRGERRRCNGTVLPLDVIQTFAEEGNGVSGWYVAFLICYTIGVMYFMIMYLPGDLESRPFNADGPCLSTPVPTVHRSRNAS